ncbi:KaiC domain-containing protein [Methanogenium organophilum]|uniref:KaiC domain-containing protein n=1 Tax=Methanogenium organophilum TaxID=2199 RepID=A0A9X9S5F1_METOG|nr:KaiC domain-containing protein [Methanogenium organophilum]WAI02254.1 KaiC domain-containing protein [Methanogenium organophilum]
MERIQFGISGLDEMFGGGLIKNSICSLIGTYGTGKTTFALQFIYEGLRNGEKVIYFSLEEREDRIYDLMEDRKFRVGKFRDESLFVIKLDPTDFNLSINSIKKDLPDLITQIGASRVVIDPISLFEGLFDDPSERRREMFYFTELLRDLDATFLLTSETSTTDLYSSKYGLIEYLSDTVVVLRYIRPKDLTEVHTSIEVVKMRRSNHSREIKPYEILQNRVNVYNEASVF